MRYFLDFQIIWKFQQRKRFKGMFNSHNLFPLIPQTKKIKSSELQLSNTCKITHAFEKYLQRSQQWKY